MDASTGATLGSHQAHTIAWDCTDETGTLVEDGEYKIMVEFTEEHSQGLLTSVTFNKGPDPQTIIPDNEANFIDMSLEYTVDATGIFDITKTSPELGIYPNPFSDQTTIHFTSIKPVPFEFKVYGLNGILLRDMKYMPGSIGKQYLQWDGTDDSGKILPSGVYFLQIHMANKIFTGQVVKVAH